MRRGGDLEIIDQLVARLGEHVSVVGNEIGELALAAAEMRKTAAHE